MVAGVVIVHLYSDGFFPISRAAWGWECTVYPENDMTKVMYMAPDADGGPKCADGSTLKCTCTANPCKNRNEALPSNLVCAGASPDVATSGCFKLHHTYGTPPGFRVWAGRGVAGQFTDACGEAEVIKAYAGENGISIFEVRNGFKKEDMVQEEIGSAKDCQAKCASNPDCKFFTYNDQSGPDGNYKSFKACVLQKALTCLGDTGGDADPIKAYSTFHGAISGPSKCPDGVTVPDAPSTATDAPASTGSAGSTTAAAPAADAAHAHFASLSLGSILAAILLRMASEF